MIDKKDKNALKKKLFDDKNKLQEKIINSNDETEKSFLKMMLALVNAYIEICQKRNKF